MSTPEAEAEPSSNHIDSLPLVDLRLMSQPELYTLSISAATHRHRRASDNDSVIPKIDRSNFNESAGSRKQTYSKLRLNKRKQNSAVPASSSYHIPEPVDQENSQIISLLQQLFGVEPLRNALRPDRGDAVDRQLFPVHVEFKQPPPVSVAFQNVPIDVIDASNRKRKRGRPRKNDNSVSVFEEETKKVNEEASAVVTVNERGFGMDADGLDYDPFGEELKRRTEGLETEPLLLEFLETLNGEWASQRKKRRIVQASDLGDLLPTGWKIVITLLRRAGRASVVCRRYVSPGGHQFESFKEASAYLLSVSGVQDKGHLKSSCTDDGAQQLSSSMNMASESSVSHVPAGATKTDANANYLSLAGASIHSGQENQLPISLSIESGNFNSDLPLGCKSGDASDDFGGFDRQTEDKKLLEADKNDGSSVQGCSHVNDIVCNVGSEKLVGAIESTEAACNLYIPLVFSTPFSNNNSDNGQISEDINAATCIKGGISNFASQDKNSGCPETVPCGVDNNGLGLSVKLVEENTQKISFDSSTLAPNSEVNIFAAKSLEDRHLISSQEDMEIADDKVINDDKQLIVCGTDQAEFKDVFSDVKLQSSSEGFSLVTSHCELKHASLSNMDRTQTSELKDSAEENIFDSDLFSSSIDERTCVHSGYISNVSFSSCTQDAVEYGGFDFSSDLKLTKDVSDNHILSNEDAVTRCLQERSSLNDQSSMMDNLLHRSSQSNLFSLTANQHPSAFHDNVNICDGTFDALKGVDAGYMEPQLGIVSCSNIAVDAYTSASIMQGNSQGCVSVPLGGSILNFEKKSDDGVNKASKPCLSEKAQNEVEIFQTDSMGLPKFL
ncbi:uncharacterized protein LOC114163788 [Vigna unguiculata]|uniref:MBD domain-containing protein n=1 Tax=Vigna unguiculata TaxID=3917 RepID=A0A4D6NR83_VIGUN|nr:uncharacterized protein LOC114163788 [Vigna unguiculata]XP_027903909.1 uncharacterized protein LOC114163788 [Vigna unguiculata]XP_027903910.1 uncharacterized protein LOC114163788 [Vigna unguiculata]QCE15898.1 hypothetical protein DEO72_LG11g2910 [Vigna unguiculata]